MPTAILISPLSYSFGGVTFTHQSGIKTTFLLYQTAGGAMTAG